MAKIKDATPWWAKVVSKIILSRIRFPYKLWRRLGVFQHGFMLNPEYAINIYQRHYQAVCDQLPPNYSLLELGPGDSLSTALLGASNGARQIWLVDAGAFAECDVAKYAPLQVKLGAPWKTRQFADLEDMLRATKAVYLTDGLLSLQTIPNESVDYVFSQAVLEHVSFYEFEATIAELFRIQPPGGVASHRIDFQDHLGHSLNSLRFSAARWESPLFARSGFYTNRLRAGQVVNIFQSVGYEVVERRVDVWEKLPLDKSSLAPPFSSMPDEELIVRGMDIVLRKPQ